MKNNMDNHIEMGIKMGFVIDEENRKILYNNIASSFLEKGLLDYLRRNLIESEDRTEIILLFSNVFDKGGKSIKGLEDLFMIDGLIKIMNIYFVWKGIDINASFYCEDGINWIKFKKMVRPKGMIVSKIERDTRHDEIEIKE